MTPARRTLLIGVGAAAALVAGLWVGQLPYFGPPATGLPATALLGVSLPDPDGTEQSLAQWKGKVLVVNFWATWCAPCREEMPMFMRFQQERGAQGVQFVGIAVDSVDKVRPFAQDLKLNYPTLIGGFGAMELSKTYGNAIMALPFTVIVDRQGHVAHTQLGPLKEAQLDAILRQLSS